MEDGRDEEGVELLRNALVAAPLSEGGGDVEEVSVLRTFTDALFHSLVAAPLGEEDTKLNELRALHAFTDALFHTHAIDEVEPLVERYREAAKAESAEQGRVSFYELHSPTPVRDFTRHAGDLKRPRWRCAFYSTSSARASQQCKTSPVDAAACCVTPACASRFYVQSLGRRSSSSPWQPKGPD